MPSLPSVERHWYVLKCFMFYQVPICHHSSEHVFSDLARDIYQNATIEKIALIRFVLDREKKTAQYDEQLNQRIPVCFYAHCIFYQCR